MNLQTNWDAFILTAQQAGWRVTWSDDAGGFVIVSPARPRHPSQELGCYNDERSAWRGAANLHHIQENRR